MRSKKRTNFIIVIIFSIAYTVVMVLNIIGPLHPPITTIQGPESHPGLSIFYWIISLIIIWFIYFFVQRKPTLLSTVIFLLVGVGLILLGAFIWDIGIRYENFITPPH